MAFWKVEIGLGPTFSHPIWVLAATATARTFACTKINFDTPLGYIRLDIHFCDDEEASTGPKIEEDPFRSCGLRSQSALESSKRN